MSDLFILVLSMAGAFALSWWAGGVIGTWYAKRGKLGSSEMEDLGDEQ